MARLLPQRKRSRSGGSVDAWWDVDMYGERELFGETEPAALQCDLVVGVDGAQGRFGDGIAGFGGGWDIHFGPGGVNALPIADVVYEVAYFAGRWDVLREDEGDGGVVCVYSVVGIVWAGWCRWKSL